MARTGGHSLIIGIGNPGRGDDAAGRAVARWLHGRVPPDIEILEHDGESASLVAHFEGIAAAYLIDACVSGAPAGTVRRFDVAAAPLPQKAFGLSTHGLGLAQAVELARALEELPQRCIVYAIEGVSFDPGAPLSPLVAAAVAAVGEKLRGEVCSLDRQEGAYRA